MRFHSLLVVAVMGSCLLGTARAAGNPQACAQAYEKAQEEKAAGRLRSAIAQLKTCIDPECPAFIREDCTLWLGQTESALSTVVFSVREDGQDLTHVKILCDDAPLTGMLDGKALPVDPGPHAFSFSVPGRPPTVRQILVREGERDRVINVELARPVEIIPASPSRSVEPPRAEPNRRAGRLVPYALAGVGVVGLAGFTVFAILGSSQQGDLVRTCSPYCQPGQVDSVQTKYHLADASLAVGIVSLGVATYLWLGSHGQHAAQPDSATAINLIPRSAGGVLQLSTTY